MNKTLLLLLLSTTTVFGASSDGGDTPTQGSAPSGTLSSQSGADEPFLCKTIKNNGQAPLGIYRINEATGAWGYMDRVLLGQVKTFKVPFHARLVFKCPSNGEPIEFTYPAALLPEKTEINIYRHTSEFPYQIHLMAYE